MRRSALSYGEIYIATNAICRALGEDPLGMLAGQRCDARAYVVEVFTRVAPLIPAVRILRFCGSRNLARDAESAATLMSSPCWREEVVTTALQKLGRPDLAEVDGHLSHLCTLPLAPAGDPDHDRLREAKVNAIPEAWRRPAPASSMPATRVVARRSAVAFDFGDPPAGRSALDERRAAGGRP